MTRKRFGARNLFSRLFSSLNDKKKAAKVTFPLELNEISNNAVGF